MQRLTWLFAQVISLGLLALAFSRSLTVRPPTVRIPAGELEGIQFGESPSEAVFAGIPYAAPPVGDLRWRQPQPPQKWTGVRQAKEFGSVCPQLPQRWLPYIAGEEDCLYLNIWTRQLSSSSKLPVIVFFHGGSNTAGYSQFTPLGPPLSRLGTVVVTANYRLGPFGFLAHPALTAESQHHTSGNYGLQDQIQALEWLRDNISQFGGDPAHVTVMGQSAGAVDICLLMSSPLAKGLFRGAILQSGECQSTLNEDIRQKIPYNQIEGTGEGIGEMLAKDLGISESPDALKELRALPADTILKAWSNDPRVHFDAIVDGWVVPEQPAAIFRKGQQMRVPILIGSNADEATVFGDGGVRTIEQYKKYLDGDTGKYAEQEFAAYPANTDAEVAARYLELQNDSFAYGAYSMALAMAQAGQKAFLYDFTFAETGKRASLGAHHGLELGFLSDSYPPDWQHSPADKELGEVMRGYWAQFAKAGDPNYQGAPSWHAFSPTAPQCLELGRVIRVQPVKQKMHALERIMLQTLNDSASVPPHPNSN